MKELLGNNIWSLKEKLEYVNKEAIIGKKFLVEQDSFHDNKYVRKKIIVDDAWFYNEGNVVWAHLANQPNEWPYRKKLAFYIRELKPLEKIFIYFPHKVF